MAAELIDGKKLAAETRAQIAAGVAALKDELLACEGLRIVHSTGKELYDEVMASLELTDEERERWQVLPYINNMGEALAGCDFVISRAGASSIAEIAALSVPAVLVPYPLATADHQTTNARYLADANAACLVPDDELETPSFRDNVLALVDDVDKRDAMRACARSLAQDKAASALAASAERSKERRYHPSALNGRQPAALFS